MEKYLIGLFAAFALNLSHAADDDIKILRLEPECAVPELAVRLLDKFEEEAVVKGTTLRDKEGHYPMVIFVNPESGTWTMLENHSDYYCIIASGEDFGINTDVLNPPAKPKW
jgi:hypothetical protein